MKSVDKINYIACVTNLVESVMAVYFLDQKKQKKEKKKRGCVRYAWLQCVKLQYSHADNSFDRRMVCLIHNAASQFPRQEAGWILSWSYLAVRHREVRFAKHAAHARSPSWRDLLEQNWNHDAYSVRPSRASCISSILCTGDSDQVPLWPVRDKRGAMILLDNRVPNKFFGKGYNSKSVCFFVTWMICGDNKPNICKPLSDPGGCNRGRLVTPPLLRLWISRFTLSLTKFQHLVGERWMNTSVGHCSAVTWKTLRSQIVANSTFSFFKIVNKPN